jgi:hypothetical protein
MAEENKLVPRESGSNGAIDVIPASTRLPAWDLSPREPHLYDYLLILRKHQWLILSFMLAVVTIVSIATFRMQRTSFHFREWKITWRILKTISRRNPRS